MINNSEIEIVEKYKYLGVVLFYNGNLKHAANCIRKVWKRFFSRKSEVLDFDVLSNVYNWNFLTYLYVQY